MTVSHSRARWLSVAQRRYARQRQPMGYWLLPVGQNLTTVSPSEATTAALLGNRENVAILAFP